MARRSDVVKKVLRFKLQLSDTTAPATVLKILQKLKDLDITLDILAETGIGKTVNSLRRHELAGEFAKSLVKGWKTLLHKESASCGEDGALAESVPVKGGLDDRSCTDNESSVDVNDNFITSQCNNQDSLDEAPFKTGKRKADSEKEQCEEQERKLEQEKKHEPSPNQNILQSDFLTKKTEMQEDKMDDSVLLKKKKKQCQSDRKPGDSAALIGSNNYEGTRDQKSRSDSREKTLETGKCGSENESNTKASKESSPSESSDKCTTMLKLDKDHDDQTGSARISRSSETHKRKKTKTEKYDASKRKSGSENKGRSKHKKAKIKHKDDDKDQKEPSMSFESFLNYDVDVSKRKERSGTRKSKKIKTLVKEQQTKESGIKPAKSPVDFPTQMFQGPIMDLINVPLPAVLLQCEKPSSAVYFESKAERELDSCDVSEETTVFTGQRLKKKMQVYSGAKTASLPAMMSLYQQCIRALQNNINLLHETGGVPFEILEPVLERCTPEQLLRIEECNPIYIGATDHLWGKHCQRDFKDFKLQEYESWKEMYIRLSEERERKLQRLTQTIVSAHSNKPKGRQVKMAFIHSVAKPPRDVRIQQEIHGTAAQQPPQLRCSAKIQDNRSRPSCNEPSKSSSTSSAGSSNSQDPRKKTRVAPMMAKSLKAFKKQLGRR
ncbi:elongin A, like [Mugil cephalus]|uniref:elongin A, like n=1 Tax=Mugil cephalus TaxID=48193 RepID=UPI001FB5CB43|nr:elongin A, like [Mugil cephalus]